MIWTSKDGLTWRLHDRLPTLRHTWIESLATDGTHLLATGTFTGVGDRKRRIATWTSADALHWTRTIDLAPTYVAATSSGFIGAVIGWARRGPVRFVRSDDGLTWTATSAPIDAVVLGLAATHLGQAIAIGMRPGPPVKGSSPDAIVLRSPDGITWTGQTVAIDGAYPSSVSAAGSGFLVSGWRAVPGSSVRPADRPTVWRTEDGLDWQRLPLVMLGEEEDFDEVFVVHDTILVAAGTLVEGRRTVVVWVSTDDGASWGRVGDQEAFSGLENGLAAMTGTDDGLLAVGRRWDVSAGRWIPVVWRASP